MPFADPEKRREYQRNRRAQQRETKLASAPPTPPTTQAEELPLATAQDVLAVIREQMNRVRAGGNQATARTLAYLLSVALKAIEIGDLTRRLDALEAAMTRKPQRG